MCSITSQTNTFILTYNTHTFIKHLHTHTHTTATTSTFFKTFKKSNNIIQHIQFQHIAAATVSKYTHTQQIRTHIQYHNTTLIQCFKHHNTTQYCTYIEQKWHVWPKLTTLELVFVKKFGLTCFFITQPYHTHIQFHNTTLIEYVAAVIQFQNHTNIQHRPSYNTFIQHNTT